MNKLHIVERLSIILFLLISIISCKKEPDGVKDIDLTDANIRVVKVEVKQNTFNPPFLSETTYLIDYEYKDKNIAVKVTIPGWVEKSTVLNIVHESDSSIYVSHNWIRLLGDTPDIEQMFLLYYGDISNFGNQILHPSTSRYTLQLDRIISINDTFKADISPLVGYTWPSQFRNLQLKYESNSISSVLGSYSHEDGYDLLTAGQGIEIVGYVSDANLIRSFQVENTLNKYLPLGSLPSFPESGEVVLSSPVSGFSFNTMLQYKDAPGVPKMLLRMVNQSFGDLLPTALSDYIITHQAFFDEDSFFWRNLDADIPKPTSYFNNDWILTFAEPRLTVLPEQDKIISSKTIQGQYLSNIASNQPIYKTMNSTVSFPYTHDPVAKTLEIAGLKIWYEVID